MADLEQTLNILRNAGYKITSARKTVLNVLLAHNGHLTSSEIINQVEIRDSSIGRASVFRTLELLTSLGIIRPTYLEPRSPIYVLMSPDGHHSHVICTACSNMIEIEDCQIDALLDDIENRHHLRLTGHLLEFYGICSSCFVPTVD